MKSNRERRSTILILMSVLLAGLGLAWALPQDGKVLADELGNCVLDSRALMVDGVMKMEAQVYWAELEDSVNQRYGTRFIIHVPVDEHLEMQDHQGTLIEVMWRAKEYEIQLFWDVVRNNAYQIVKIDGVEQGTPGGIPTRYTGTYDALTQFVQPTYESIVPSATELDRVRFNSVNRGVTTRFCLENRQ